MTRAPGQNREWISFPSMDDKKRPDPEALLQRVMQEERRADRGRLKIILGYTSRVGKTTRMLEEVRRRNERGQAIVVGRVRPSPEIVPLLEGLEVIPPREVGDGRLEMDLDASWLGIRRAAWWTNWPTRTCPAWNTRSDGRTS